jgi:putative membrane protein
MHRFNPPFDPRFHEPWWHGFLGWFIPFLIVVLLVGLAVWAILRVTGPGRLALASGGTATRPGNGALDLVRARYARGEISRDEFIQLSADLGGQLPPGPPPAESS